MPAAKIMHHIMGVRVVQCSGCRQWLPVDRFGPDKRSIHGVTSDCSRCRNAANRAIYAANPPNRTEVHAKHLRDRYDLTPGQVDDAIRVQEGRCAICWQPADLHVDHNHETGEFRGMLCGPCNRGIGLFAEDPERLESAAVWCRGERIR